MSSEQDAVERLDVPVLRHPHCRDTRCKTCLKDHGLLEGYLLWRTGASKKHFDMLGEYRSWLDRNGYDAETEHGWATPAVFEESSINAFVDYWR